MPRGLPRDVRSALEKARECALLAVDAYNRPATTFRTGGFIVLMVVAWTSLFHAIFYRRGEKPYYRKGRSRYGRFERIDGEPRAWELKECLRRYFGGDTTPVRQNLEFFVRLRNRIEHRLMPELDSKVFGECQSMLLNFDNMLAREFGERYCLNESLTFALQFSRRPQSVHPTAPRRTWRDVARFVDDFRSSLSADVMQSNDYCFKAYLVPKIGTHRGSADVAIEWVHYDPSKPDEMQKLERVVALVKPKLVPVVNPGTLKPGGVAAKVAKALGIPFGPNRHAKCWRYYKVRPPWDSPEPAKCTTKYCQWDPVHGDYVYTEEWVQFLIRELSDPEKRKAVIGMA